VATVAAEMLQVLVK